VGSSWNIQFNRSISQSGNRDGIDWFSQIAGTKSRTPEYLCVPNIRFSMDAENRRGKFVT